jgi:hypothetical protein
MSARIRAFHTVAETAAAKPFRSKVGVLAVLTAFALQLAACAEAPPAPVAGADPSNPGARTPPVGYRSTVAPYNSQRPVEPAPWGEQNQRVAPPPKSGQ